MVAVVNSTTTDQIKSYSLQQYDQNKFKFQASIRWLCGFIPSYHQDTVKNNVRKSLDFLSLPPQSLAGNAVWRDIVALLVSCEAYRCASLAIFGPPAPTNHWQVIQTLSRHGVYVTTEDGSGVVQTALLTASPFHMESHGALIDGLMQAYAGYLVTIPRVVAVVKKIGSFNASQELPYDLEDSLLLWINKVCGKVKKRLKDAVNIKRENLKLGLIHPSSTLVPPNIPHMEDLIQDISDGQCLGVILHYYLDTDLPLDALKFGPSLSQSDKASNLAAVRFTVSTVLGTEWFPLSVEMILNPSFTTRPNVITFISELFWRFELKGVSRCEMSTERWMKLEDPDMNCAAAANEISLQLDKNPVPLSPAKPREEPESSDDEGASPTVPTPVPTPQTPAQIPEVLPRELMMSPPSRPASASPEPVPENPDIETTKYFDTESPVVSSIPTPDSNKSQSLGSLSAKIETGPPPVEDPLATAMTGGMAGPTVAGIQLLHSQTEEVNSSDTGSSSSEEVEDQAEVDEVILPEPLAASTQLAPSHAVSPARRRSAEFERRKSGEEIVEEMREEAAEKREFFLGIARWVDSVEQEQPPPPPMVEPDNLTVNISRTIETHFNKTGINVGSSYTICKSADRSEAESKGLPVIDVPVTPAPAPPQKIQEDYMMTVQARDEALRKKREEEERQKREELDRKRQLEEKQAEERRLLEELSDTSSKGKKGKKKKGGAVKPKEGKTFPRRPGSVGSNSSAGSAKGSVKGGKAATGKGNAKGGKGAGKGGKGKTKDDMSVKSEKISRTKSTKAVGSDKRRVKSARRAGKSVSFIDEQSEPTTATEITPALELIPTEDPIQPPAVCPFKKDTDVIGEDRPGDRQKTVYFVPFDKPGVGLGSGPIRSKWNTTGLDEDSLVVMQHSSSESSSSEEEEEEEESEEEDVPAPDRPKSAPPAKEMFSHILTSLQPQFGTEPILIFENRQSPVSGPAGREISDPRQLTQHLQLMEKRRNIQKCRSELRSRWEEERANMNRHVFYEALKKTRDAAHQTTGEEISAVLEQTDSLAELITRHHHDIDIREPFNTKTDHPNGAKATNVPPKSLMERAIEETEQIFCTDVTTEEEEALFLPGPSEEEVLPRAEEPSPTLPPTTITQDEDEEGEVSTGLVAVFSDHGDFLATKIPPDSPSSSSPSRKPTAMQYFYGFTDVATEDRVSQRRQQFLVAQQKKQAELRARRELEAQRKLEAARHNSAVEGQLRRTEGNLVTKCRAQSCRVRVVREEGAAASPTRPYSAKMMACRTPTSPTSPTSSPAGTTPTNHMYPERARSAVYNGGETFRKATPRTGGDETFRDITERPSPGRTTSGRPSPGPGRPSPSHPSPGRPSPQLPSPGRVISARRPSPKPTPRPPALPLFVPPSAKSNSKVIVNALSWTCLSGVPDKPNLQLALQAVSENTSQQYVILFRDAIAKKFRAIYAFDTSTTKLIRIYGKGPKTILTPMLSNLYKYDSGSRSFSKIPTLTFSLAVDGITIKNELWRKAGVFPC